MKKYFLCLVMLVQAVCCYCQRIRPIHNKEEARQFFQRNVMYPQDAIDNLQTGLAMVVFTVYADGTARRPLVMISQGTSFTQSVLDVVKQSSGQWIGWTKDSMQVLLPVYYKPYHADSLPPQAVPTTEMQGVISLHQLLILPPVTATFISVSCAWPTSSKTKQ